MQDMETTVTNSNGTEMDQIISTTIGGQNEQQVISRSY